MQSLEVSPLKQVVGKIEIKDRAKVYDRILAYTITDELNSLENEVFALTKSLEIKDKFKRIKNLVKEI